MSAANPRRVVVTGRGAISPLGHDWSTVLGRLPASDRVQRNVLLSLKPAIRVPVRLPVSDHVDKHARDSGTDTQSLTTEMSGASTAFMPTTW